MDYAEEAKIRDKCFDKCDRIKVVALYADVRRASPSVVEGAEALAANVCVALGTAKHHDEILKDVLDTVQIWLTNK